MKDNQKKAVELKSKIERACIECGLNITIHEGKIAFVDQNEKKIVAVWAPEHTLGGTP